MQHKQQSITVAKLSANELRESLFKFLASITYTFHSLIRLLKEYHGIFAEHNRVSYLSKF